MKPDSMITIFSHFKAFQGHAGLIQRNAIMSWAAIRPKPPLIFFGMAEGTAEAAAAVGADHVPTVRKNAHGAAIMSDLFAQAAHRASTEFICYANGDMILMPELAAAAQRLAGHECLMVGYRTNLDLTHELDFTGSWQEELRREVSAHGVRGIDSEIDYFVISRSLVEKLRMPDFAIGRACWDNWMIFRVRELGRPVIDISPSVLAVHQNHDYGHHPAGKAGVRAGVEGQEALRLAGGQDHLFFLRDVTHILTAASLQRYRGGPWRRRLRTFSVTRPWLGWPIRAIRQAMGLSSILK